MRYIIAPSLILLFSTTSCNGHTNIGRGSSSPPPSSPSLSSSVSCPDRHTLGIEKLYVFGDSFSDVGNIYTASNYTEPASPPYFQGRYSNGRTYVDFVSQMLGLNTTTANDYAYGGATTDNDFIPSVSSFLDGPVPSVAEQVQTHVDRELADASAPTTVHILWAGYNDYWWYTDNNAGNESAYALSMLKSVSEQVVMNTIDSLQQLVDGGAKRLVVADMVDMKRWPDAKTKSPAEKDVYGNFTEFHNEFLGPQLDTFRLDNPGSNVRLFSVNSFFQNLQDNPDCFGITETDSACLVDDEVCDDPFGSIFWDLWHPTTTTHKRVADALVDLLVSDQQQQKQPSNGGGSRRLRGGSNKYHSVQV